MVKLKINNVNPIQKDFMGNGAIYHGYAGMPDSDGRIYSEKLCEIEAKRISDMRLKIARTRYNWWAWDKETNTWNWDNEIMTAFYKWLQRMKNAGVTVALNVGWYNPGDLNDTGYSGPGPFKNAGDWNKSVDAYADFVSETVHQLIELRGFDNIKILVLFTEPQTPDGVLPPNGMNAYQTWYQCAKAAHNALVKDGRRNLVKLMGPNEGSTITSEMLKWLTEHDCDFIDIFSSHNYLSTKPIPFGLIEEKSGIISLTKAGARFHRQVNLEKNKEYTLNINFKFASLVDEVKGDVIFGIFEDKGINDLYSNSEDILFGGTEKDSVLTVAAKTIIDKENLITYKFKSKETKTAIAGFFYDVKTEGVAAVDKFEILDENGIPLYKYSDFSVINHGWKLFHCSDYADNYAAWSKWCKTGLQYVPKGKPYCFDEYNSVFSRDNSRLSHGAEIVNAAVSLMNSGAAASLVWTIFDQQWPNSHTTNNDSFVDGDHRCGTAPVLTRSLVPYRSFYAFSILSRYVDGNKTKIFEGIGERRVNTTMSVSKDGEITVVVVNDKEFADDFTIDFDKSLNGISLNRHYFDPNTLVPDDKGEIIKTDKIFENVTTGLTDKIAPYGVIVYTTHKD